VICINNVYSLILKIIFLSQRRDTMSEITVQLAILGNGCVPYRVAEGTTVGQLRDLMKLNPSLQVIINNDVVGDNTVLEENQLVIGAQPVKGGC
jgi:hypothetical protein